MKNNSKDADEDINELLRLQAEFIGGQKKAAASCIRPNLKVVKLIKQPEKSVKFAVSYI